MSNVCLEVEMRDVRVQEVQISIDHAFTDRL